MPYLWSCVLLNVFASIISAVSRIWAVGWGDDEWDLLPHIESEVLLQTVVSHSNDPQRSEPLIVLIESLSSLIGLFALLLWRQMYCVSRTQPAVPHPHITSQHSARLENKRTLTYEHMDKSVDCVIIETYMSFLYFWRTSFSSTLIRIVLWCVRFVINDTVPHQGI